MISIEKFGKDHWSTFAYIETRIVDYLGRPDRRHLRCINERHPAFAHQGGDASKYPTRLKGGAFQHDHDDWDCLEDLEEAGLLVNINTGINPIYQLTDLGREVAGKLRGHKGQGGNFADFDL